jgi:hypothetical protein
MADDENARLRAELEATRQQLAQQQAANQPVRGEVHVPIAEGLPSEGTPLNGQPRPTGVVAMGKAVQDNKMAAGSGSQTCIGIGFAIACLCIYYLNGGDKAACSTKLPVFLKVNGYASIAYILTTMMLVYLSTRGKMSSASPSFKGIACLTSLVGCFLFAWFICGLVWFFQTTSEDCDPGMYQGSKIYFILALVVPLALCCCLSCCMVFIMAGQASGAGGVPDLRRP